jgi:GNAT superfamily N-acetyltransferase
MSRSRIWMRMCLHRQDVEEAPGCRTVSQDDVAALGSLMLEAYRGTVDYEGEDLRDAQEEVRGTFGGKYGPFLPDCSFLIETEGQPQAACLITWSERLKSPLLTYSITHPNAQNRGLGAFLICQSINALVSRGHRNLYLVVTEGNAPAQHLYEKLGFRVLGNQPGVMAGSEGEGR